ncbi:MAG: phosphoribosylformylglycinamidine synthase subunit PurS, partial [Gemmatimonadaceae bacterium]
MKSFRVSVHIVPRKGLLDPQGKAVADALHTLGFQAVSDVHVGRHLLIDTTAADAA